MNNSLHENLERSGEVKGSSNRSFGLIFASLFAIIGVWPLISSGQVQIWSLCVAFLFLVLAIVSPIILAPLNMLWTRFGLVLHKIVNPIVMGILFFVVITPTALVVRLLGNRLLETNFDHEADSYWIVREPPGPEPVSLRKQF